MRNESQDKPVKNEKGELIECPNCGDIMLLNNNKLVCDCEYKRKINKFSYTEFIIYLLSMFLVLIFFVLIMIYG